MKKFNARILLMISSLLILTLIAGCGGGSGAKRPSGLNTTEVVQAFFDASKAGKLNEAGLYVAPDSTKNTQTVIKYVTGQEHAELKKSNLLSVKNVAQQGDYAVVLAALQEANTLKTTFKPVGMTRINNEWYIVEVGTIYQNAKYKALQQLMENIKF